MNSQAFNRGFLKRANEHGIDGEQAQQLLKLLTLGGGAYLGAGAGKEIGDDFSEKDEYGRPKKNLPGIVGSTAGLGLGLAGANWFNNHFYK